MAWITIEEARTNLQLWLEAEKAIASAQSYRIGNRQLTRADLAAVIKRIAYWQDVLADLEAGGEGIKRPTVKRFVPVDN